MKGNGISASLAKNYQLVTLEGGFKVKTWLQKPQHRFSVIALCLYSASFHQPLTKVCKTMSINGMVITTVSSNPNRERTCTSNIESPTLAPTLVPRAYFSAKWFHECFSAIKSIFGKSSCFLSHTINSRPILNCFDI